MLAFCYFRCLCVSNRSFNLFLGVHSAEFCWSGCEGVNLNLKQGNVRFWVDVHESRMQSHWWRWSGIRMYNLRCFLAVFPANSPWTILIFPRIFFTMFLGTPHDAGDDERRPVRMRLLLSRVDPRSFSNSDIGCYNKAVVVFCCAPSFPFLPLIEVGRFCCVSHSFTFLHRVPGIFAKHIKLERSLFLDDLDFVFQHIIF